MLTRSKVMVGLAATNLTIGGAMLPAELRMRRAAGRGIVALEFAGSERRARALMRAWGRDGRRSARRLQWLDFAYSATYAPFLRLATRGLPANSSAAAAASHWRASASHLPKPSFSPVRWTPSRTPPCLAC